MFCRYCGQEIPNDSMVCTYCGKKLKKSTNSRVNDTDIDEKTLLADLKSLRLSKQVKKEEKEEPKYSLPSKKRIIKTKYIGSEPENQIEIINSTPESVEPLNVFPTTNTFTQPVEEPKMNEEVVGNTNPFVEQTESDSVTEVDANETNPVEVNTEVESVESSPVVENEVVAEQPVQQNFEQPTDTQTESIEATQPQYDSYEQPAENNQPVESNEVQPNDYGYSNEQPTENVNEQYVPQDLTYDNEKTVQENTSDSLNTQPQETYGYTENSVESAESNNLGQYDYNQNTESMVNEQNSVEQNQNDGQFAPLVIEDQDITTPGQMIDESQIVRNEPVDSTDYNQAQDGQINQDGDVQNFDNQNMVDGQDGTVNYDQLAAREQAYVQQMSEEPANQNDFNFNPDNQKQPKVKKDKSGRSNVFGVLSLILTILTGLFIGVALVFEKFGDKLQNSEILYNITKMVNDLVTKNYIVIIVLAAVLLIDLIFAIIQLIRKGNAFAWINLVLFILVAGALGYGLYSTKMYEDVIKTVKTLFGK